MVYFCGVKRFMAILLLALYLLTATEFKQLFKIPVLVQHYQEHKAHDAGLSFAGFLYMHYAGDDKNENDQDRDMQLPFKSCDGPSALNLQLIPPSQPIVLGTVAVMYSPLVLAQPFYFNSNHLSSIWQPPKSSC